MSAGAWFWVLYVICLLFGGWSTWPRSGGPPDWRPFGWSLVVFVLIGLLGWGIFGPPLR